jgi:hypothetical protein
MGHTRMGTMATMLLEAVIITEVAAPTALRMILPALSTIVICLTTGVAEVDTAGGDGAYSSKPELPLR